MPPQACCRDGGELKAALRQMPRRCLRRKRFSLVLRGAHNCGGIYKSAAARPTLAAATSLAIYAADKIQHYVTAAVAAADVSPLDATAAAAAPAAAVKTRRQSALAGVASSVLAKRLRRASRRSQAPLMLMLMLMFTRLSRLDTRGGRATCTCCAARLASSKLARSSNKRATRTSGKLNLAS